MGVRAWTGVGRVNWDLGGGCGLGIIGWMGGETLEGG